MNKFLKEDLEVEYKKPVILAGDLNVSHKRIDLHRAQPERCGYTPEERESLDSLLTEKGMVDTYRIFNPDRKQFTFWNKMYNKDNRKTNRGKRYDYIVASRCLMRSLREKDIQTLTDVEAPSAS